MKSLVCKIGTFIPPPPPPPHTHTHTGAHCQISLQVEFQIANKNISFFTYLNNCSIIVPKLIHYEEKYMEDLKKNIVWGKRKKSRRI